MENMQTEETIDMGKLMQILYDRRKTVGTIVGGCTALALIVSLALPKTYESTTLVQTRSAGKDIGGGMAAMAAAMGFGVGGGSSSSASPANYIELMQSRRVLAPIIDELYADEKPDTKGFAKSNLKIENIKHTNLIAVTAKGKTPEEAQMISQSVVDNFLTMQTENSKQTQSLLITFLSERIENAKQESDDAAKKLADFSKEHKIFNPDDQAKDVTGQVAAFDKSISEVQVKQKSAQAEYDAATQQLGKQKANTRRYNINDNSNVVAIRSSIIEKEISLAKLRQNYTEENPLIINAKRELKELHTVLANEVNTLVESDAATINSAQMESLSKQAVAEAEISAAKASEAALKEKKAEKEQEMEKLPEDMMNFLELKSDSEIKQKIYLGLVQECEQDKIQEAMESMDIQIIDPANLPDADKPAGPRKKLITVIGFVTGCLLSLVYGLICYKKEEA